MVEKKESKYAQEIENLNSEIDTLKKEVSAIRKKGKKTLYVDLKLTNIPYKIKLFEVTEDPKDLNSIKVHIEDVKKEIEEAKQAPLFNEYDEIRHKDDSEFLDDKEEQVKS